MTHASNTARAIEASGLVLLRVVPYAKHPVADGEWDEQTAREHGRKWAGFEKLADATPVQRAKYAELFAGVRGDGSTEDDYVLPHHDVRDGKLVTVKRGVSAALARVDQVGGFSSEERATMRKHLEEHEGEWSDKGKREASARVIAPDNDNFPLMIDPLGTVLSKFRLTGIRLRGTQFDERPEGIYSWNQIARTGKYKGHPAGPFEFSPKIFDQIIANFRASENQELPLDFEHATELMEGTIPQEGAPATGWIQQLENRGDGGLWGLIKWLEPGLGYVRSERYKYFSPAVQFDAIDARTGEKIGPLLTSGAMTNRPFLDGMQRLAASGRAAEQHRATAQKVITMGSETEARAKNMDADGVGRSSGTPPGDTQPEPKYLKFAMAAGMDDHHASEDKVLEHLKKMAKEHAEMKARLSAIEAEHKERESKRAKAEVGKLVKLGAIKADEAVIAKALTLRMKEPDTFEALYGDKLEGEQRETTTHTMSEEQAWARTMMSQIAPNRGSAPAHPGGGLTQPGLDPLDPPEELITKLMKDDPSLDYTQAVLAASSSIKAHLMSGKGAH